MMQAKIRPRVMTLLVALVLVLLPACRLAVSPAPAAAQEPVTLDLWLFAGTEEPENPFMMSVAEAYEAAHPNVTVEVTLIPEDQYTVKLDTAIAAGSPPDIGYLFEPRWVKAGKIVALDETIAAQEIDLDDLTHAAVEGSCVIEGHIYCLGSHTGAVVLFYDKAKFDAAGLEYPSATEPLTVDEYAALAAQLTAPNDDVNQQVWGASAEAPYWWMNRTAMFSEDAKTVDGVINDEATKHAYEALAKMVSDGHAPSASIMQALGMDAAEDLFLQGKLAMLIGDFTQVKALEEAGIDFGVATLPVEQAGDPPYLPMWTDGYAVFSDSQDQEAALEYVAYVGSEGSRLRVEEFGDAPLSAAAATEFGWTEQGNREAREQFLQVVGAAEAPMFVPGFWDVVSPLGDAFNLVAEGEATAADVLDEAAPRMQDSLDQAWVTWEQLGG